MEKIIQARLIRIIGASMSVLFYYMVYKFFQKVLGWQEIESLFASMVVLLSGMSARIGSLEHALLEEDKDDDVKDSAEV